ncbi:MAG: 7,8-didemethyl-8-hydroxy-5-deazariboflavin synthase subunit CofG [Cyanobacteriota bacterium]|nr:7,8-didemethyl-8-hydroxy-5-deazariboflavin synthase subunit CofG [Cyanobacteriota bacterium]
MLTPLAKESYRPRLVTYSPAYTLVPTYECFNRCRYCNFRVDPGQDQWLTLTKAEEILLSLRGRGVTEILILSGEVHPRSPQRRAWTRLLLDLGQLALDLGFYPHTNAGPLSYGEMAALKAVNASMGLMLEQLGADLAVHAQAPSKDPQLRLAQLIQAGELAIPFTTGLLLGIGETPAERREGLKAIARIQRRYGHIQEIILQPHSPGSRQSWEGAPFHLEELPGLIAEAREILPPETKIQIPPNLIPDDALLLDCLRAGAEDLGGIVPKDEVNPDYGHRSLDQLETLLASQGWELRPRLPDYRPLPGYSP